MCGCHMEFLYFITILFLHLVHPVLVESTGCCVVDSVCALECVKCEKRDIHICFFNRSPSLLPRAC